MVNARNILLLSDIGFLKSVGDYFKNIFEDIKPPNFEDGKDIDSPDSSISSDSQVRTKNALRIPPVKVDAHVKDVRVAVIESEEETEPQALTLKVDYHS